MSVATTAQVRGSGRFLVTSLMFIALVVAVVGSLGAPLITSVSATYRVGLTAAQWTLTITLLSGAIATPVLGRLGSGGRRREVILWALAIIVLGSLLTVLPLPFAWLLTGRAAQGTALGLTALMMGVARDHVPEAASGSVIAMLSVASPLAAAILVVVAAALLAAWARWERRAPAPLTDPALPRHPAVVGANMAMFAGGIGMYLLLTLVTRYVQTPAGTGYGFGFPVFVAGLVLVPFSALGFTGGRVTPWLRRRGSPAAVLAAGAGVVLLALVVGIEQIFFHCAKAFMRSALWKPETWDPGALPSHAAIVKSVQDTPETLEELEAHYGPSYADRLYR